MKADYGFQGFFELRTPQHLFGKLKRDHKRLSANPLDSYAAFDFFVTANCLVDWIWPSASPKQKRADRRTDTIPRICEHLADGAKHFILSSAHSGVAATERNKGAFDVNAFDSTFHIDDELVVTLEPAEANELNRPTRIGALALASLVLEYWERRGLGAA